MGAFTGLLGKGITKAAPPSAFQHTDWSTPPPGFVPVPASKVGLWHKKVGDGYIYWRPPKAAPKAKVSKKKAPKTIPGLGVTVEEFDAGIEPVIYMMPPINTIKPTMEHFGWYEIEPGLFEKSFEKVDAKTQKPVTAKARFDVHASPAEVGGGLPYEVAQTLGSAHALGMLSLAMNATASELHAAKLLGYQPDIAWNGRILGLHTASYASVWKKGAPAPADVKAAMAALEAAKKKKEPKHPTEIEDEKWETAEAAKERKALTYTAPPPGRNDYPSDHEQLNQGVYWLGRAIKIGGEGTLKELAKGHPELPLFDILDAVTLFTAGHVPTCRDPSKWDGSKATTKISGVDLIHSHNGSFSYKVEPTRQQYVAAGDMLRDLGAVPYRGTMTVPIGRGMRLPPKALKAVAVGQVLELGYASSFSKSDLVVENFMNSPQNDIPDHWPKVKIVFEPGTLKRGCDVSALSKYRNEEEVIIGGQIRITDKRLDRKTGVTTLTVVQDEPS